MSTYRGNQAYVFRHVHKQNSETYSDIGKKKYIYINGEGFFGDNE